MNHLPTFDRILIHIYFPRLNSSKANDYPVEITSLPLAVNPISLSNGAMVHQVLSIYLFEATRLAQRIEYPSVHMYLLQVTGDQSYLELAKSAGDVVWQRGLLRKGYGLCHGTAGNGYVFLDLYRATNDTKWLHRAMKVSN